MLITPSGERVNIFFGATVQSVISKEFKNNHRFSTFCTKPSKYSGFYVRAYYYCLLDFYSFFVVH